MESNYSIVDGNANPVNIYVNAIPFQATQSDRFDFTLIFEQSVLSIIPSIVLIVLVPLRLYYLHKSAVKTLPDPIQFAKHVTKQ